MPSMLTHYLCGKKINTILSQNLKYLLLNKYEKVYNLGTLGPDILFFHNQWPWKKDTSLSKVADIIHSEKVNLFFKNMLTLIMDSKEKNLLLAYFMGFCSHYVLDCTTHPYIFYFSGFNEDGVLDAHYTNLHREFETNIDFCISKEIENKTPYDLNSTEIFDILLLEQKLISELLAEAINKTYKKSLNADIIFAAIDDFKKITDYLRDKNGFKHKFLIFTENILKIKSKPSSIIYPLELDNNNDYLNISKNTWYMPWDNSTPHNESFIDIFEESVEKSIDYLKSIMEFNSKIISLENLLKKLGNLSYSTGIDCDKNIIFKYKHEKHLKKPKK
ncbi:MAG: zinc dependent phospholipase C family protein [Clostridiales bacterium]